MVSEELSKAAAPRKPPTHPPAMEMVKEALKELDSRKGVSAQAVRTFIKEKHPTVDESRLKFMVRRALVKGLESGTLVRPANSNSTGAQGRFRVRNPLNGLVGFFYSMGLFLGHLWFLVSFFCHSAMAEQLSLGSVTSSE